MLDLNSIKSYREDPKGFDLTQIVVAVIIKDEYRQNLKITNFFKNKMDWISTKIFPYSLINFQKPSIIFPNEPRIPAVGLCIQNTYNIQSTLFLSNWIDFQLSFGFAELRFYDATENASLTLTMFIKEKYNNDLRLTVRPYNKTKVFHNLFNKLNDFSQRNFLLNYARYRFNREVYKFADHITTNDCFTELRYKYEFVAHFDLDEIIIPRGLENTNPSYACNSACSFKQINFYDYLNSLVESERKGRDRSKFGWIDFRRTTLFVPKEKLEVKLINHLQKVIKEKSDIKSVFVRQNEFKNLGYNFEIEKEDVSFVKSLIQAYKNLSKCIHRQLNTSTIDSMFIRYLYFVTSYNITAQKNYKKIHYYKNVNSIFTHWAVDYDNDTWSFIPSPKDGHVIHHFRHKTVDCKTNATESIRLLNIDSDYSNLILQKFSDICNHH